MAVIYLGSPAIDRPGGSAGMTQICREKPASDYARITKVEIWANTNLSGCIVATFYNTGGNNFTARNSHNIGTVAAGAKRTFSGLNLLAFPGDYIGMYSSTGMIDTSISGGQGVWKLTGDHTSGSATFSYSAGYSISLRGTATVLAFPITTHNPSDIVRVDPSKVTANGLIEIDEDVTERGFKYGLTEADTWSEYETGTFSSGAFSLQITGLDPDTIYYIRAYIISGTWGTIFGAYIQFKTAVPYWSTKTEIKAEAIASDEDINKVGGIRTLPINNHLIQTVSIAQNIANAYLAEYKDQKIMMVVDRPIPLPYERGDTIKVII